MLLKIVNASRSLNVLSSSLLGFFATGFFAISNERIAWAWR